jgi:hypothetical protein
MIIDTSVEPRQPRPTQVFRKREPTVRFTVDQSRRQNELIRAAWNSFESKDAVIAFLNTHNECLGGEPLRLAMASDDGLYSAARLLEEVQRAPTNERTTFSNQSGARFDGRNGGLMRS